MKQRRSLRSRVSNNSILKFVYIGLILAACIVVINFAINLLPLRGIDCVSQYGECNSKLQLKLDGAKANNFLSGVKLVHQILKEEVAVDKYNIQYLLLRLKINVIERRAQYALAVSENSFYLVDKEGRIIGVTDVTELPTIRFKGEPPVENSKVSSEALFALNIILHMYSVFQVKSGYLEEDRLTFELPNKLKAIFPLTGDIKVLMGGLILIYNDLNSQSGSKLNTDGKIIDTIDLRFSNPVLH